MRNRASNAAAEQAREDLRYLVREITTRHPNPYYLTPKAAFDRQAAFECWPVTGSRTAYVAFNSYLIGQSRSDFGDLARAAFRAMDAAQVDRVIVDLRWNGGGDFTRGRYEAWPDDVPGVPPDRLIPPTWADYRDGRDAALE